MATDGFLFWVIEGSSDETFYVVEAEFFETVWGQRRREGSSGKSVWGLKDWVGGENDELGRL